MNERPTPETDAVTMQPVDRLARAYTFHGNEPFKYSTKELVPAEVARKLERERDEAREEAKRLEGAYEDATNYYARIIELIEERDEARKEAEYHKARYDLLKESW